MIKQLFYNGPSFDVLHEEFTKKGYIDENAPVKSSGDITIHAPIKRVWDLLINLSNWPAVIASIRDVRLEKGATIDAPLSFRMSGFPIHARLAVITPGHELTWTGVSLWFKAIDRHVVEPAQDGYTRLYIEESFAGVLALLFLSSAKLRIQHEKWLAAFKRAAEDGR